MVLSKIDNARADAALSGFSPVLNRIEAHRSPSTRIFFRSLFRQERLSESYQNGPVQEPKG